MQKTIIRNKEILAQIGISPERTIEKLKALSLGEKIISAFEDRYRDAMTLGYPSPETVFEDYFAVLPPFKASGNKKSEFPDAFVLEAIKEYLKVNPHKYLLVISNDDDWENAISDTERVSFAYTLEDGLKTIQSAEGILPSFYAVEESIKKEIIWAAEGECFDFRDYEPIDDIEVKSIRVSYLYDDIVPLRITQTDALIKCSAELAVDGTATVFDDESSIYDPETDTVLLTSYLSADFKNAPASIECEVKLLFDPDDWEGTVELDKVKINCRYCIELDLGSAEVEWKGISPERD